MPITNSVTRKGVLLYDGDAAGNVTASFTRDLLGGWNGSLWSTDTGVFTRHMQAREIAIRLRNGTTLYVHMPDVTIGRAFGESSQVTADFRGLGPVPRMLAKRRALVA